MAVSLKRAIEQAIVIAIGVVPFAVIPFTEVAIIRMSAGVNFISRALSR